MRKVILNMKEKYKYDIIKKVVENNLSKNRASLKLNLSIRQINRLVLKYKQKGKQAFIHGNKHKVSSKRVSDETRNKIIELFQNKYNGTTIKHFTELLDLYEDIKLSHTFVRNLFLNSFILSPRASKRVKKRVKHILKTLKANVASKKQNNEILDKIDRIDYTPHCKREKSKYMGEMIQMDASSFDFLGNGIKLHLHIAVDDCTNTL